MLLSSQIPEKHWVADAGVTTRPKKKLWCPIPPGPERKQVMDPKGRASQDFPLCCRICVTSTLSANGRPRVLIGNAFGSCHFAKASGCCASKRTYLHTYTAVINSSDRSQDSRCQLLHHLACQVTRLVKLATMQVTRLLARHKSQSPWKGST